SSRYDASGNSGVINIKTKKGQAGGFNGSVMAGGTAGLFKPQDIFYVNPRGQMSFNFNYRKNKLNFFGSYNPNFNRSRGLLLINRKLLNANGDLTGYSDVTTKFKFGNFNQTLRLGVDLFADKKNTFGFVASGFLFNGHPTPVTVTTLSDQNHVPKSTMVSLTENRL